MVRRWHVDPAIATRIKKAGVVNAVRMLVDEHPGGSRPWIKHLREFVVMFVNGVPGPPLGVALPDPDISRKTAAPGGPAEATLLAGDVIVGRALENRRRPGDVRAQLGELVGGEELEIRIIRAGSPVQPAFDPALAERGVTDAAPGGATMQSNDDSVIIVMEIHMPGNHDLLG